MFLLYIHIVQRGKKTKKLFFLFLDRISCIAIIASYLVFEGQSSATIIIFDDNCKWDILKVISQNVHGAKKTTKFFWRGKKNQVG